MMNLLETGQALYVLAGICLLGILTRLMTRNLYKRLLKECTNLTVTRNKGLKELKLRAENTYRLNQGLRDTNAWLEHQLGELRFRGMTLGSWSGISLQLTWLCLLGGGAGAFFSYWYRLDTSYIVMYGCGAVLMAMLTMLFDNGAISGRREQLTSALQDYLENVLCPRLARSQAMEEPGEEGERNVRRLSVRPGRGGNGAQRGKVVMLAEECREESGSRITASGREDEAGVRQGGSRGEAGSRFQASGHEETVTGRQASGQEDEAGGRQSGGREESGSRMQAAGRGRMSGSVSGADQPDAGGRSASQERGGPRKRSDRDRSGRRETAATAVPAAETGQDDRHDVDYLKRSLEQIAASRERNRGSGEEWMKGLSQEQMQLLGDIIKEYLV